MPNFAYRALDAGGRPHNGTLEAPDRQTVARKLAAQGMRPTKIEAAAGAKPSTRREESAEIDLFKSEGKKKSRFTRAGKGASLEFLKRLHVLLTAGMAIGDAVRLLSQRLSDPTIVSICEGVWRQLSEGHTLSRAMRDAPGKPFSASVVHLVEAGEASGTLVPVLERIIQAQEEANAVRKELMNNLSYPAFVITVAFGAVILIVTFLMPRIERILNQLGGEMPWVTKLLLDGTDLATRFGPFVLLGMGLAALGVWQWRKGESGRYQTDLSLLKLPVLSRVTLYASIFSTTNLMATLLNSGVNTTETLRLVEKTINNRVLQEKFAAARRQISEGVSMATAIGRVHYMPPLAMDILTVGENTGNVVTSLLDINRIYRDELSATLKFMTTAVVAIALTGAILLVLTIAVSVILGVLSVSQSIQA